MRERWFTGFEDALGTDLSTITFNGMFLSDAKWPARSGDFCLSAYAPTGTVLQARRSLANTYTCLANGDKVIARMQLAVRPRMYPSVQQQIFGYSIGTTVAPAQDVRVYMDTTGRTGVQASASNGGIASAFVGPAATLGKWYVVRLHYEYERTASADPVSATIWVYDGDTMDDEDPVLVGTATSAGSFSMSNFSLSGVPCLGTNTNLTRIIDYDDWWLSVADGADADVATNTWLAWPTGSRVQVCPITGQGPQAGWTGDYLLCRDIPNSSVAANEQTATGAGLQTTFLHPTAAALGLIPPGQLADAGTPEEQEEAPPFSGLAVPEGFSAQGRVLFGVAQDLTLPTPTLVVTPTAGAGLFNSGVWVRAFTVKLEASGSSVTYRVGPLSAAQFISAATYPNFAAQLDATFGAGTPGDAFTGVSSYVRYGIGVLVSNAYSTAKGLFDPTTASTNFATAQTNTVDLLNQGGPGAIDAGLWDSIVALQSYIMPNGVAPPYPFTNPLVRASTLRFLLSSPRPAGTTSSGGSNPQTDLFGNVFTAPAGIPDEDKPIAAAIKVYAALKRTAGSGTDQILIAGVAYNVSSDTSFGGPSNDQIAFDWTERDAEEFDALVFGAQTGSANATQLGNCLAEVMTAGPCTKRTPGQGQYRQQCGIYVSNNSIQKIALPFRASAIFVKRIGTAAAAGAVKAWWMGGTLSWIINSGSKDLAGILLIEEDGFLVGPSNNVNGVAATYAYVAIFDGNEDTVNDAYLVAGSYQRAGTSDPDLTVELPLNPLFTGGWTPDTLLVFGAQTFLKTPQIAGASSLAFGTTGLVSDGITAFGDGTFTTGVNSSLSALGQYPYFALRFDAAGLLATLFQTGSFAGTGGAQNVPTNFRGEMIVLDHPAASYTGRFRSDQGNSGNNSVPWPGGSVTTTDITAINDVSFDVGAGASVSGQTSYWTAWKRDGSIGNAGSTELPPSPGPDPGQPPESDICGGGGMKLPPGTVGGAGCVKC